MSRFFGKPAHTAFVVPDIDREIERVLAAGLGPVFTLRRLKIPGRYRGVAHTPVSTAAFVASGGVLFEILQQHDEIPSAYTEFLERNPGGGLHHVAYYSADFDADMQRAKAAGLEYRIVQEFLMPNGAPFEIYMEAVNAPNPLLIQLMYGGPTAALFGKMEDIAASWDGSAPVRDLFELLPPEIVLPRG